MGQEPQFVVGKDNRHESKDVAQRDIPHLVVLRFNRPAEEGNQSAGFVSPHLRHVFDWSTVFSPKG
jgi:hypothetical protein